MIKEEWQRWIPNNNVHNNYYLISIKDTMEKLLVHLAYYHDDSYEAEFSFENHSVLGYRQIDEGCRLQLYNELNTKYGTHFYASWSFFIVKHSRFLAAMTEKSINRKMYDNYIHFSFFTTDYILDIVAKEYPSVKLSHEND